jgi:hypothetical protein
MSAWPIHSFSRRIDTRGFPMTCVPKVWRSQWKRRGDRGGGHLSVGVQVGDERGVVELGEGRRGRPGRDAASADEEDPAAGAAQAPLARRARPGRPGLVEHEYRRRGTLAYLAAMDVHDPARGLFGRCEHKISNQAFDALLSDVMTSEPRRRTSTTSTSFPSACSASNTSSRRRRSLFTWTFTRQHLHALLDRLISAADSRRPPERTWLSRY